MSQDPIEKAVNFYNDENSKKAPGVNIEFELRFQTVNRDNFTLLFNAVRNNKTFGDLMFECSLNIMAHKPKGINQKVLSQSIFRILYGGNKPETSSWIKTKLIYPHRIGDVHPYTINISSEEEGPKPNITDSSTTRFKNRASFTKGSWRLDMTIVQEGIFGETKLEFETMRKDYCTPNSDPELFLKRKHTVATRYEVELEFIGDKLTSADLAMAGEIMKMLHPTTSQNSSMREELMTIAKYLYAPSVVAQIFSKPDVRARQLLNKAIALTKSIYFTNVFPTIGYYATEKTDGERVIAVVNGNRCRLVFEKKIEEFFAENTNLVQWVPGNVTIVDCELWEKKLTIFDCICFMNHNLSATPFSDRYILLEKCAEQLSVIFGSNLNCVAKQYQQITNSNLKEVLTNINNQKRNYPTDGIILTMPDKGYIETYNYKWKPFEKNTIDFLAAECPSTLLGAAPYVAEPGHKLYILHCGISYPTQKELGINAARGMDKIFMTKELNHITTGGQYYPIQFSSTTYPLSYLYQHDVKLPDINGKIVELGRNQENTKWVFHKIRDDRSPSQGDYGNDYKVAELTFMNYVDPFELENLWSSVRYFEKSATPKSMYSAQKNFMRFGISVLMKKFFMGCGRIIDLASGRGADTHRYEAIGTEYLLCLDKDRTAITELVNRLFDMTKYKKTQAQKIGGSVALSNPNFGLDYEKLFAKTIKAMTVHAAVVDLTEKSTDLLQLSSSFGMHAGIVEGIICNFAFHYLCDTSSHISNILNFISRSLAPEGRFMAVVMDGQLVFDKIKNIATGQQWQVRENGVIKYAIKKLYSTTSLEKFGQMISIKLPFSNEMYDEPLCNIDHLTLEAMKVGLTVILSGTFDTYLGQFAEANAKVSADLSEDDKAFISMFRFIIFEKKIKDKPKRVTKTYVRHNEILPRGYTSSQYDEEVAKIEAVRLAEKNDAK